MGLELRTDFVATWADLSSSQGRHRPCRGRGRGWRDIERVAASEVRDRVALLIEGLALTREASRLVAGGLRTGDGDVPGEDLGRCADRTDRLGGTDEGEAPGRGFAACRGNGIRVAGGGELL